MIARRGSRSPVSFQTVGAGDVFTGVFAAALVVGQSPRQSMLMGQAAAARHVAGLTPLGSLNVLAAWAHDQHEVPPRELASFDRPRVHLGRALATAVGTTAAILSVALFG